VDGRKCFAEMDAEDGTDVAAQAKRLHGASPRTGKRRSLRQIAAELARLAYLNERGRVFNPKSVSSETAPSWSPAAARSVPQAKAHGGATRGEGGKPWK
jgi:hypothetical protein